MTSLRASKVKVDGVYTDEYGIKPKGRITIPTPERDIEQIEIKGRDGSLTKKYGYKDLELPVTFTMHSSNTPLKKVFRISKPFLVDAKTLEFDDDDVYYRVKDVTIEPVDNTIDTFGEFVAEFTLDPFAYEVENNPIVITSSQTIENEGYKSLPKIKVWCSGNGELTINNQTVQVTGVNGTIVIDSELVQTYQEGSPPINASNKTVGDYPVLVTGSNSISFSGDISKLEVTPNFRWR